MLIDKTTPKDLALKIEWIGLQNLSHREQKLAEGQVLQVSRHLPKILARALWSYFGKIPPEGLQTRTEEESRRCYNEREKARHLINDLVRDVFESNR